MGGRLRGRDPDDKLDLVQVGDSRAYVMRGEQIRLATKDNHWFSNWSMWADQRRGS